MLEVNCEIKGEVKDDFNDLSSELLEGWSCCELMGETVRVGACFGALSSSC